jgi:nucleotide-binding universal stress UspA family protein
MTLPIRRILVPLDLSEPALGALDVALSWSGSFGSADQAPEVIVLHVIPRVFDFADVPLEQKAIEAELASNVTVAGQHAGVDAGAELRREVRWADSPADEILRFAEAEAADMIVMGTHGYGAFKRALIGSVASGVAREANRPVLLVPPLLWRDEAS